METGNGTELARAEEVQPQEQPLAIREDAVPARSYAAEKITDVLPPMAYERIGQLTPFTAEQEKELDAPTPDDEFDIKPDGAVYASHEFYRRKLNKVFGRGGWTLIPGSPLTPRRDKGDNRSSEWYQRWVLFVGGVYFSEAIASRTLWEDNKNMTLDDVAEAIKSDALRRCSKDLGIATEAWNRRKAKEWRDKYAIEVLVQSDRGNKKQWRRRDADPFPREIPSSTRGATGPVNASASQQTSPAPAQEPPKVVLKTETPTPAAPPREAQKATPVPQQAPAQAAPKPSATQAKPTAPQLLDSQIRLLFARARQANLIVGEDAEPLMETLEAKFTVARIHAPGKTSLELCHAMLKTLPPVRFQPLVKELDAMAKAAKEPRQAEAPETI